MIGDVPPIAPVPRTALVTGGAGSLGFAIAERLAGEGRRVALLDQGQRVGERAAALEGAVPVVCDVADEAALEAAYREVAAAFGPIGVVVHAAGIAPTAPFLDTDRGTFERTMAVNLTAAFSLFQCAARDLIAAGCGGRFISIASISGARAGFARAAYGTSKAGLIHLTGQMALELGPYGITANAIAPGPVDTPLARAAHTAETRAEYVRAIPVGRYGEEADVAHAAVFLAADASAYVSGHTLFVDGGYMASGIGVSIAQSAAAIRRTENPKDPA